MTLDSYDMRNDWRIIRCSVPQEIVVFLNKVFLLEEIRRRVGKINGITFEVRSQEQNHSIPHVHASYGEYSVSIAIEDGRIMSGNLPKSMKKLLQNGCYHIRTSCCLIGKTMQCLQLQC